MGEIAGLRGPERLAADHDLMDFGFGKAPLDDWLRTRARNSEGRSARTYVVCDGNRVVAYYCLSAGSVARDALPKKAQRNTPDQVPVVVIGRLAVDARAQGNKLGSGMLRDAIARTLEAANAIGVRAILVHAIDDEAAAFYRLHEFVPSLLHERTLMLPLESAARARPA